LSGVQNAFQPWKKIQGPAETPPEEPGK
jgi:hypothetical protein